MRKNIEYYHDKHGWSFALNVMTPYERERHEKPYNALNIRFFRHSWWFKIPEFIKPKQKGGDWKLRIKSFSGDEKEVLKNFSSMLNKLNKKTAYSFAGHNIREFDIPYLCRRMMVHQMELPALMDISGKKPYEVNWVDTMQLWRFGDIKHYTSLKLLAATLGITTPKDDIEGKDVGRVFWKEKNLPRIVSYCQKDVATVAQLVLRFKGMSLLDVKQIEVVD